MIPNFYLGSRKRNSLLTRMLPKGPQDIAPRTLYKKSLLMRDQNTGEINLSPVGFPDSPLEFPKGITFNAEAECRNTTHSFNLLAREVPSKACTCGFHAYSKEDDAKNHIQSGADSFVLKVVASGKMLEYEKGYRYGHQRVEEIVVSKCFMCPVPADRVIILGFARRPHLTAGRITEGAIAPVCSQHAYLSAPPNGSISFDQVSEIASRSLPTNAPRIRCYSSSSLVQPWVSGIGIDAIGKETVIEWEDETRDAQGFSEFAWKLAAAVAAILIPVAAGVAAYSISNLMV